MQEINVYDSNGDILYDLVQWDDDVFINIKEDSITKAYQVHFFNQKSEQALVVDSTYDNGVLKVKIPNDLLCKPYLIIGYINVVENEERKCLYGFKISIRKKPKPSDIIYTDTLDYVNIQDILKECRDYADSASISKDESKSYSEAAEISATNAKNSEDASKISEDNAKISEDKAKVSETNAKDSEINAGTYANDANIYMNDSKTYSENAKTSEDNAKASELAAIDSENKAKTSETNAKDSENKSKASELAAKTSADNAKNSENAAQASKDSAKISEDNAKTSETNSKNSEINAGTYADNASAYKNDAKISADNAKISEDNAKASELVSIDNADNAKVSELAAKISEDNAKASELAAKASEDNTKTSESNADNSANNAKISADNAKISEDNAKASELASIDNADKALASEVDAKESQDRAKASELAAKASADSAKASEDNAKASELAAAENASTIMEQIDNAISSADSAASSADSASASMNKAKESETAAATSASNAEDFFNKAKSYAVGEGNVRPNEAVDSSKYYYEQSKLIAQGLEGSLLPMGTIAFEQLTDQNPRPGYMYNVSNAFTTDDTFKEGAGYKYSAGTNVYRTADGYWDCFPGVMVTSVNGEVGDVTIDIPTIPSSLPANGGNADTVGNKNLEYIMDYSNMTNKPTIPTTLPASNTTSDYSATDTNPVNGIAVNKALQTLNVETKGGTGKYIQSISETDGKISAVEATMPTIPTTLKNPQALTFTGGVTGSYDGSTAMSVTIPTTLPASNTTSDYSASGTAPVNGTAVNKALQTTVPIKNISYTSTTKTDALAKLDNPNTLFPNSIDRPYVIIFSDNVGDSPLGGGNTLVFGYIYAESKYGCQIALKYSNSSDRFKVRNLNNGTWTSWDRVYDTRYKPTPSDIGALPLTGGSMTGNISYQGTKATFPMIKFIDNISDVYGNGISIGGGGPTVIGGGESSDVLISVVGNTGSERMVVANDGDIEFYTNCQNGAGSATRTTISGNTFSGIAQYANMVNGVYTGNGGQQSPSYALSGKTRFNMWNAFKGITNPAGGYMDVIIMDNYTGSDVPYVTGIGVTKNNGDPRMFIANGAKGGTGNWARQVEVLTSRNIGFTTSGKNYAVQLSGDKMYVNVPWTDTNTTYSLATTSANGLMSKEDKVAVDFLRNLTISCYNNMGGGMIGTEDISPSQLLNLRKLIIDCPQYIEVSPTINAIQELYLTIKGKTFTTTYPGLVPKPSTSSDDLFLTSSGNWKPFPTSIATSFTINNSRLIVKFNTYYTDYRYDAIYTSYGDYRIYCEGNPAFCFNGTNGLYLFNKNLTEYRPLNCSKVNSASSIRYKENVKDISVEECEKLLQLRPITFNYKVNHESGSGFIAEEVEPIYPQICSYRSIDNEDGSQSDQLDGLNYTELIPYIVKLVQRQDKEIQELKSKIEVLESKLN